MSTTTVRISKTGQRHLRELTAATGESMQALLDKAIEAYRRELFLKKANEEYAALRRDPKQWKDELKERAEWDSTLSDDLEED